MKNKLIEFFGWYGTVAIIAAYALTSFGLLSSDNIWYQILNGTGAIGIVILSFNKKAFQPAVLNIIWTVIALIAIAKILM